MAKDNLFLGFGRGKIGDVVFYRRNGQQIARARNRAPRNPNTFKQQLQRAVSANVQRLYSVGMQVFNHSFEGYKVGDGNQRVFLKQNMDKLRSLVVSDYNLERADTDCLGRIGAPGLTIPVPFDGMIISNGSVQQTVFAFDSTDGFLLPEPLRNQFDLIIENVGQYALRIGLIPGDIYTFVAFGCDPLQGAELAYYGPTDVYTKYAGIYTQLFAFSQLRVKTGVTEDETLITNSTTLSAFFEPGQVGNDITGRNMVSAISQQAIDSRMASGMIGCIRSREDSGVRSPSFMHVVRGTYDYGLTVNYLEKAWGDRSRILGSDLLLEGSDFLPSEGRGSSNALYTRNNGSYDLIVNNEGKVALAWTGGTTYVLFYSGGQYQYGEYTEWEADADFNTAVNTWGSVVLNATIDANHDMSVNGYVIGNDYSMTPTPEPYG